METISIKEEFQMGFNEFMFMVDCAKNYKKKKELEAKKQKNKAKKK